VKWHVAIRPRAEADLLKARNWYENKRPGLGDEFLAEIGITIELLAQDPERRPDYYRGFRRALTRRFPYKMFYRLEGNQIIVFRVLHAHRDHPRLLPRES
jgi:toxin ParE1/3/4